MADSSIRSPPAPHVEIHDHDVETREGEANTIRRPSDPRRNPRAPPDIYPSFHPHSFPNRGNGSGPNPWGGPGHSSPNWKAKQYGSGVKWREQLTGHDWKNGRVLLIDYVSKEHSQNGRRKIVAQEFWNIEGLQKFYAKADRCKEAALRVIHVQNASWATRFLLQKFNINHHNDLVGTDFSRWAKYERPQRRAGKPVLNGKTFKAQRDPWRGINRTAFGIDYLKQYERQDQGGGGNASTGLDRNGVSRTTNARMTDTSAVKMMELNCYDEADNPTYGYDVFVQRLSVYIQRKEGEPSEPDDPTIVNPYIQSCEQEYAQIKHQDSQPSLSNGELRKQSLAQLKPILETLDNSNTTIVFEHCTSGAPSDTLIPARGEIETRWRRLAFYLPREAALDDDRLALECMDLVLSDVFKSLAAAWERYLYICSTHVGILEDKIYESPADESRAPELWTNSSLWLKVEKLITIHVDTAKEMQAQLEDIVEDLGSVDDGDARSAERGLHTVGWIRGVPAEFEKIANRVQEDLVKPTENLNDLMYKSVGIRDSRHSLQLGTSMWRLSWITFIFLPLTFIVGFFGMNADIFADDPSIKWYFISAVPLMVLVFVFWYVIKHFLAKRRQTPYQRGIYEHLYHDLSTEYPTLWTRSGPRRSVRPQGFVSSIQWRLLELWFAPEKTIRLRTVDQDEDGSSDLGTWARAKRNLARRWLRSIKIRKDGSEEEGQANLQDRSSDDLGAVTELLEVATPVAMANAEPTALNGLRGSDDAMSYRLSPPIGFMGRMRSVSEASRDSSGIIEEEKGNSDEEINDYIDGDRGE
ncbi:MAG: hypothetical protein M1820_007793 [Bogoriella megaspora]|nr:MAG: hypothetical protein M1820_007793 [Bogoriella megaspora]